MNEATKSMPMSSTGIPADPGMFFGSMLEPLLPNAFRTARYFTRDSAAAEDLVQEASLRAFRAFSSFAPGTNFRAWFMRILKNVFYERCRKDRRRVQTAKLDDLPEHHLYLYSRELAGTAEDTEPAQALLSRLDTQQILDAIEALPREFREVAALYFVDDYSYQEMAEILGCPVGTVRSRLHRSRRILKRSLWEMVQEHRGTRHHKYV